MLVFQLGGTHNALKRLGEYRNEVAGKMNPASLQNPNRGDEIEYQARKKKFNF